MSSHSLHSSPPYINTDFIFSRSHRIGTRQCRKAGQLQGGHGLSKRSAERQSHDASEGRCRTLRATRPPRPQRSAHFHKARSGFRNMKQTKTANDRIEPCRLRMASLGVSPSWQSAVTVPSSTNCHNHSLRRSQKQRPRPCATSPQGQAHHAQCRHFPDFSNQQ